MSQLFSIKGRLGRSTYQNYYLFVLGIAMATLLLYEIRDVFGMDSLAFGIVLFGLIISFITLCTTAIRRLHDLDRPAWHLALALIPVYNIYLVLYLLCMKGEAEVNAYGVRPEPL